VLSTLLIALIVWAVARAIGVHVVMFVKDNFELAPKDVCDATQGSQIGHMRAAFKA